MYCQYSECECIVCLQIEDACESCELKIEKDNEKERGQAISGEAVRTQSVEIAAPRAYLILPLGGLFFAVRRFQAKPLGRSPWKSPRRALI